MLESEVQECSTQKSQELKYSLIYNIEKYTIYTMEYSAPIGKINPGQSR